MKIEHAITEPLARIVDFHNTFNSNIKLNFGALQKIHSDYTESETVSLPTGGEPWGDETFWRKIKEPIKDAAIFLSELGIARAAAAFEDYATGAKGEFDRANCVEDRAKTDGTASLHGFDAIVGLDSARVSDIICMVEFFTVARNCIVHQSNRANKELSERRDNPDLQKVLSRWQTRPGKWQLSLPPVIYGKIVEWQPRHAILASDVYYRAAREIDRALERFPIRMRHIRHF